MKSEEFKEIKASITQLLLFYSEINDKNSKNKLNQLLKELEYNYKKNKTKTSYSKFHSNLSKEWANYLKLRFKKVENTKNYLKRFLGVSKKNLEELNNIKLDLKDDESKDLEKYTIYEKRISDLESDIYFRMKRIYFDIGLAIIILVIGIIISC